MNKRLDVLGHLIQALPVKCNFVKSLKIQALSAEHSSVIILIYNNELNDYRGCFNR